jgi:hypothetical protein
MHSIKEIIHSNFNYIDYCYLCSILHKLQYIQSNYVYNKEYCSLLDQQQINDLVNKLNGIKTIYETRYLPASSETTKFLRID